MLRLSFLSFDRQILDKSRAENWHDGTTALAALLAMTPAVRGEEARIVVPDMRTTRAAKTWGRKNLAETTETTTSEDWSESTTSSATSVSSSATYDNVLVTNDGTQNLSVYIANAGDCRAISVYGDGRVLQLSTDHSPSVPYERLRIFKAGGNLKYGRIEGKLSVSRGFGDRQFKEPKPLVSATPEVVSCLVTQNLRFIVLACDGVWGWLNNVQVARFVSNSLQEGNKPEAVVKDLVKYAFDQGSTDNISVVLLYFTMHNSDGHLKRTEDQPQQFSNSNGSSDTYPTESQRISLSNAPNADATMDPTPIQTVTTPTKLSKSKSKKYANTPQASTGAYPDSPVTHSSSKSSFKEGEPNTVMKVPLTASLKSKKYNFSSAALLTKWARHFDMVDRRADKALVLKTHIPSGECSALEQAEYESTASDVEALNLDPRLSVEYSSDHYTGSLGASETDSKPPSTRPALAKHADTSDGSAALNNSSSSPRHSVTSTSQSLSVSHNMDISSSDEFSAAPSHATSESERIPVPINISPKKVIPFNLADSSENMTRSPPPREQIKSASPFHSHSAAALRVSSVPDEDEFSFSPGAKIQQRSSSAGPGSKIQNKALSKKSGQKTHAAVSRSRSQLAGISDSETDEAEEMMRRRSFDDVLNSTTTESSSNGAKIKASRGGSSKSKLSSKSNPNLIHPVSPATPTITRQSSSKKRKESVGDADSGATAAEQAPTPAKKAPPMRRRVEPSFDDDMKEEALVHRRAASFDVARGEIKKKKKQKL